MGLIFAEFATSLKSPKKDTATKNKPCYMSSFRVLEIVKIGLSENLALLPSVIFAQISLCKKFGIYTVSYSGLVMLANEFRSTFVGQIPVVVLRLKKI